MTFPNFFIDRPIFAGVLSVVILVGGGIAYMALPVAQYPEVAPPTVVVRATFPGATPEVIADTVATPLEQEVNGVEGMLYMESQSANDGSMSLTVTFALGTDLDTAQVQVQNRVAAAEPRLPEVVRRIGVVTTKESPNLLLVVHLLSPDGAMEQLDIANYALQNIRDRLSRIEGVGNVRIFGAGDYSMRIWLDGDKLAALSMTAGDVVAALREQNVQVAAGVIGQEPVEGAGAFQIPVSTLGRLTTEEEFGAVVVRGGEGNRLVRVRDVARVELGAQNYSVASYLNENPAVAMLINQRPGSNALETATEVRAAMDEMSDSLPFPPGLEHRIVYDPTKYFIEQSIDEVFVTLYQAVALVVLVVFLFLGSWRATLIPAAAIPVSLVGTFGAMLALGFSLNSLSLFGLVLAIGIVVDDAIVVVENVERKLAEGLSPRDATRATMAEVGSALIATSLVLIAVFVPTAFIPGISGQFYRQFALTIAFSTAVSTFVSLTLSPALATLLLRRKGEHHGWLDRGFEFLLGWLFRLFDRVLEAITGAYAATVKRAIRFSVLTLGVYGALVGLTYYAFDKIPTGFIPPQDQGYVIVALQLPDGASLDRTDAVTKAAVKAVREVEGVTGVVSFAGFSGATRTNASNAAAMFPVLAPFAERAEAGLTLDGIVGEMRAKLSAIPDAMIVVIPPPPVRGLGNGGGYKYQIQARDGQLTPADLEAAVGRIAAAANDPVQHPNLQQVFSTYRASTPQYYVDFDRERARILDVPIDAVFETLQVYLGSLFVNDFNLGGRTYQVNVQAEQEFRDEPSDIARLRTRNADGEAVPLGSLADVELRNGPDRVVRYNLYPAADLNGDTAPGVSSGEALREVEAIADAVLPAGFSYEPTDIAYQQRQVTAGQQIAVFCACVLFVYLALAAQFESLILPLAIVLIVPMSLLAALGGVWFRGLDNNILTQIGLVVLVGLACKNAILIVEFAAQLEEQGRNRIEAAIEACRLRFRAILMTAFSFVLGVLPLVLATGAGAEMRIALGTAVFAGMIGVTLFGLILTPVFYTSLRKLGGGGSRTFDEETPSPPPERKLPQIPGPILQGPPRPSPVGA
ncbi:efflux RND transporter permease subunit [Alienimonas chondri]|uniref:Multidrug efflux RND transporter permease subunit OqxB17 n=1 Tax=Alienimonas chondri TaxID=2681879 RepID=A0ABX1V7M5_9PLAN|nr:multidrug efflux RND transporter permease subunit [Alienimonas chondri]NNJ24056.1 multidrug efflux RND transporter permease subunit OqxB17 [Alienimonas chondri]